MPIIFLTALNSEPDFAFRSYSAGTVDYIAKPFDPWVLRAKVSVFVDLYEKNRQLSVQATLLRRPPGNWRSGRRRPSATAGGWRPRRTASVPAPGNRPALTETPQPAGLARRLPNLCWQSSPPGPSWSTAWDGCATWSTPCGPATGTVTRRAIVHRCVMVGAAREG